MRGSLTILVAMFCFAVVTSYPLRQGEQLQSEALNRLMMVEADNETALRSKRTIGILRQLFPGISQMIEEKVNSIVGEVIRVLGPIVLRTLFANNGGGGGGTGGSLGGSASFGGDGSSASNGGSTITAASPFDDDDDDDNRSLSAMSSSGSRVSISLPTYPPDEEDETESTSGTTLGSTVGSTPAGSTPTLNPTERADAATNIISNAINSGPTTNANTLAL